MNSALKILWLVFKISFQQQNFLTVIVEPMTLKHVNVSQLLEDFISSYKFKKVNDIFRDRSCENQQNMTLCTLLIYSIDQIYSIPVFRKAQYDSSHCFNYFHSCYIITFQLLMIECTSFVYNKIYGPEDVFLIELIYTVF